MSRYFPLFVDLEKKKIILFGAGEIAARRLDVLLRFGAQVTIIAPQCSDAVGKLLSSYSNQTEFYQRCYQPGEIEYAFFVLSATDDPQTDDQIFLECRRKGIPVNIASDQTKCDFFFPALVEQENIVIGVSSGGADHQKVRTISAKLRTFLADLRREDEK